MAPVRKRAQSRPVPQFQKKRSRSDVDVVSKKKNNKRDEEILSEEDEDERFGIEGDAIVSEEEEEEVDLETADEKRLRIARAFLDRTREAAVVSEVSALCEVFCNVLLIMSVKS